MEGGHWSGPNNRVPIKSWPTATTRSQTNEFQCVCQTWRQVSVAAQSSLLSTWSFEQCLSFRSSSCSNNQQFTHTQNFRINENAKIWDMRKVRVNFVPKTVLHQMSFIWFIINTWHQYGLIELHDKNFVHAPYIHMESLITPRKALSIIAPFWEARGCVDNNGNKKKLSSNSQSPGHYSTKHECERKGIIKLWMGERVFTGRLVH